MTVAVVFAHCHHTAEFTDVSPPVVGDTVFCLRCNTDRLVESAPAEWRIRCMSCPYGKPFGVAKIAAEIAAARHANKRHHTVRLLNGRKLVHEFTDHTAELPLGNTPEDYGPPPY